MRWVAGFGALLSLLVFAGGTATPLALGDGTTVGGEVRGGSVEAVVVVGRSGTIGSWSGTPRGGARLRCGYYGMENGTGEGGATIGRVLLEDGPVDPEAGELYVRVCVDQSGRQVSSLLTQFDPGDPLGGIAATERALEEARRRLDPPDPTPALNPPVAQLVGVPTWLWVEGPWEQSEATAAVGSVTATVTARPTEVVWDTGDGTTTTCDAGTPYDTARPPGDQHSSCTHVFTRTSRGLAGGTYAVTATVTYEVEWTASTGAGGDLGTIERSTTVPVAVGEAQAVIR